MFDVLLLTRTAVIKYHKLSDFEQRMYGRTVLEVRSLKSGLVPSEGCEGRCVLGLSTWLVFIDGQLRVHVELRLHAHLSKISPFIRIPGTLD